MDGGVGILRFERARQDRHGVVEGALGPLEQLAELEGQPDLGHCRVQQLPILVVDAVLRRRQAQGTPDTPADADRQRRPAEVVGPPSVDAGRVAGETNCQLLGRNRDHLADVADVHEPSREPAEGADTIGARPAAAASNGDALSTPARRPRVPFIS